MNNISRRVLLSIIVSFVLGSCIAPSMRYDTLDRAAVEAEAEKQRRMAVRTYIRHSVHLKTVGLPILEAGAKAFPDYTTPDIGVISANKYSYYYDFDTTAASMLDLGDSLTVVSVLENSPAKFSGMEEKDLLISINGKPILDGYIASNSFDMLLKRSMISDSVALITILRDTQYVELVVEPRIISNYSLILDESLEVNAFADGNNIYITRGMMRFVEDDVELSLVIAHELAHNVMGHSDAVYTNYLAGSLFDLLGWVFGIDTWGIFGSLAAEAYSQEFEKEADYIGLYLMANAGIKIETAPIFWRRLAAELPANIETNHTASHPSTPERFVAMENTISEIALKLSSGEAITIDLIK